MASKVDYIVSLAVEGKEYSAAVQKASQDMDRFKKRTEGSASSLSKFAKGFGLVAGGATAAKAAYALFNKATSDSQTLADEWARQVAAVQSAYDAFVSHLTGGDLSGFFSNFNRIISKAREAADALDRLATVNIFAEGETADYMAQIFAARTKLSNKTISREERNAAKAQLDEATKNLKKIGGEQVTAYTGAFNAQIVEYLSQKGFNTDNEELKQFEKYYSSLSGYDTAIALAGNMETYRKKKDLYNAYVEQARGDSEKALAAKAAMDEAYESIKGLTDREKAFIKALSEISDPKLIEAIKNRIAAANIERQLSGVDRENMEVRNRADSFYNFGAVNAPKGSIAYLESELKKRNEEYAQATDDVSRRTLKAFIELLKQEIAELKGEWQDVVDEEPIPLRKDFRTRKWNEKPKDDMSYALTVPQVLPEKTEEATDKMNQYASAISAVSAAFGSLSGAAGNASDGFSATLGAMQSLASGISSVISAYIAMAAAKEAATKGLLGVMLATTIVSSLVGIVNSVKGSVGSFAQGGIVGGTSYTGDRLSANVNSGEMILNQAQQRNLLALATYGGGSGEASEGYVRGDTIYMSLHNFMKRTGKRL